MSLKSILMDIFPFLFKAVERYYDDLPQPAKDALLQSGKFAQILKQMYADGYDAFVQKVSAELGMSQDEIDMLLMSLAKKLSIDIDAPNQLFDKLQAAIDKGLEDSA